MDGDELHVQVRAGWLVLPQPMKSYSSSHPEIELLINFCVVVDLSFVPSCCLLLPFKFIERLLCMSSDSNVQFQLSATLANEHHMLAANCFLCPRTYVQFLFACSLSVCCGLEQRTRQTIFT